MRNRTPPTDARSDRERRLQSVLDEVTSSLNSADLKLSAVLQIALTGPQTSAELIWRLQGVLTLQQIRSLKVSIDLLKQLREDVGDVRS